MVRVVRGMGLASFGKPSADGTKVRANADKRHFPDDGFLLSNIAPANNRNGPLTETRKSGNWGVRKLHRRGGRGGHGVEDDG